eukprot:CAMPEP_0118652548 /NCGR_PEP_ID=MMETSP0785-20121206/11375_1 /TAXON_ID=91992 /ORGANISM="Bolidomonas pacifica, Strain CCMP 1866" /LENGTH=146 /DNA_ID=CAMNT_0006545069 /DNA_START=163 /DNA_END=600 /DNA_ORIENTATION=+
MSTQKIPYPPPSSSIPPSFQPYISGSNTNLQVKHYTLVILHVPTLSSILLGLKNRGFGCGFYNSFGGKIEKDEDVYESAVREVKEETGLDVRKETMVESRVGTLRFAFDDEGDGRVMVVELFKVNLDVVKGKGGTVEYGCEEITPE